jgi:hypothetical protein
MTMADEEQFTPELGDEESFDEWEHPEPGPLDSEGWLDPDVGVPPVVDDLRPGETLEQRNARLLAAFHAEKQADRPEGTRRDPATDRALELFKPGEPVSTGQR